MKFFKKHIFLSIICLLIFTNAFAQQDNYSWRIGIGAGYTNYYGDLSHYDLKFKNIDALYRYKSNRTEPIESFAFTLEKSLSPTVSLIGQFSRNVIYGNDSYDFRNNLNLNNPNFSRALNFRSTIQDYSIGFVFSTDNGKIFKQNAFFSPYVSIALGYSFFDTYGDLYDNEGNPYAYLPNGQLISNSSLNSQYETSLAPLQTEGKDYNQNTFNAGFGLGLKFRLTSRIGLHIESQFRYLFTDYIDDVSGNYPVIFDSPQQAYASNPSQAIRDSRGSKSHNDLWAFHSISLRYSFGKPTKHYKTPAFNYNERIAEQTKFIKTDSLVQNKIQKTIKVDKNKSNDEVLYIFVKGTNDEGAETLIKIPRQEAIEINSNKSDVLVVRDNRRNKTDSLQINLFENKNDKKSNENKERTLKKSSIIDINPVEKNKDLHLKQTLKKATLEAKNSTNFTNESLIEQKRNLDNKEALIISKIDSLTIKDSKSKDSLLMIKNNFLTHKQKTKSLSDSIILLNNNLDYKKNELTKKRFEQEKMADQIKVLKTNKSPDTLILYKEFKHEVESWKKENDKKTNELVNQKNSILTQNDSINQLSKKVDNMIKDVEKSEDKIALKNNKINALITQKEALIIEQNKLKKEKEINEKSLTEWQSIKTQDSLQLVNDFKNKLEAQRANQVIKNKDKKALIKQLEEDLNKNKSIQRESFAEINQIETAKKNLTQNYTEEYNKLEALNSENTKKIEDLNKQIQAFQQKEKLAKEQEALRLEMQKNQNAKKQKQSKNTTSSIAESNKQLSQLEKQNQNILNELSKLKSQQKKSQVSDYASLALQVATMERLLKQNKVKNTEKPTNVSQITQKQQLDFEKFQKTKDSLANLLNEQKSEIKGLNEQIKSINLKENPTPQTIVEKKEVIVTEYKDLTPKTFPVTEIFFDMAKYDISVREMNKLNTVVQILKQNPNLNVQLTGMADATGNPERNLALSKKRAHAILEYMVLTHQIEESRILISGIGQVKSDGKNALDRKVVIEIKSN